MSLSYYIYSISTYMSIFFERQFSSVLLAFRNRITVKHNSFLLAVSKFSIDRYFSVLECKNTARNEAGKALVSIQGSKMKCALLQSRKSFSIELHIFLLNHKDFIVEIRIIIPFMEFISKQNSQLRPKGYQKTESKGKRK